VPDGAIQIDFADVREEQSQVWENALDIGEPATDTGRDNLFLVEGTDETLQNCCLTYDPDSETYVGWCSCEDFSGIQSAGKSCDHLASIRQHEALNAVTVPRIQ
jgi:hypothetical protein